MGFRKAALPQKKEWTTVVWLLDNRGQVFEEGRGLKGLKELKEALATIDQVNWSHGYRGGKPMMPCALARETQESATQSDPQHASVSSPGDDPSFESLEASVAIRHGDPDGAFLETVA